MVIGSMVSASVSGSLITRYGRWKIYLVVGAAMMTLGFGLLSTIDAHTDMVLLGGFLFVLGVGMGMTMQNLVLAVQNNVRPDHLGSATSTVAFFRSLGGAAGVSVLGAVLSNHVTDLIARGLSALGVGAGQSDGASAGLANLNELPAPIADIVRGAYGDGTARIFLVAAVMAGLSLIAILFIKEVALNTLSADQQRMVDSRNAADIDDETVDPSSGLPERAAGAT
jgi:MFS family permease